MGTIPKRKRGRPAGRSTLGESELRAARVEADDIIRLRGLGMDVGWHPGDRWPVPTAKLAKKVGKEDRTIRKYRSRHKIRTGGDALYIDYVNDLVRRWEADRKARVEKGLLAAFEGGDRLEERQRQQFFIAVGQALIERPIAWVDGSVHDTLPQLLARIRGEPSGATVEDVLESDWPDAASS